MAGISSYVFMWFEWKPLTFPSSMNERTTCLLMLISEDDQWSHKQYNMYICYCMADSGKKILMKKSRIFGLSLFDWWWLLEKDDDTELRTKLSYCLTTLLKSIKEKQAELIRYSTHSISLLNNHISLHNFFCQNEVVIITFSVDTGKQLNLEHDVIFIFLTSYFLSVLILIIVIIIT